MSRDYSNFLLFAGILDAIPDTNPFVKNVAQSVINPRVDIVEQDCGTKLGQVIDLNMNLEGKIELATDLPLTYNRIAYLFSLGFSKVALRNVNTCTSNEGICAKCYQASYNTPGSGTVTIVPSSTLPLLNYLAQSYSGSILGMASLDVGLLPLRSTLYAYLISETELKLLSSEVLKIPSIPSTYADYCDIIQDPLEKALFLIVIYAIFSQIT